jgi:NADPH-dependent curcumin reductase CurA
VANARRSFFPPPPAPERPLGDAEKPPAQRHWELLTRPPQGELGQLFPIRQFVSRDPDHAIALLDGAIYSTGVSLRVALYSRRIEGHSESSARIALVIGDRVVEAAAFADSGFRELPPAPQLDSQNPCGTWGPPGCTMREWWVWGWRPGETLVIRAEWPEAGLEPREIAVHPEGFTER